MSKRLNVMKVNSYKKGTCLITLQKYVIVNMCNELKKKNWWQKPKPSENSKIIEIIVFWSNTTYCASILLLGFRSYSNKQFMRAGKVNF